LPVHENITSSKALVSNKLHPRTSASHLSSLFEKGVEPRAIIAVALSRAALVSDGRIGYVLGADVPASRQTNAQKIVARQLGSHLSATRATSSFQELAYLKAPDDLVEYLQETKTTITGGEIGDG